MQQEQDGDISLPHDEVQDVADVADERQSTTVHRVKPSFVEEEEEEGGDLGEGIDDVSEGGEADKAGKEEHQLGQNGDAHDHEGSAPAYEQISLQEDVKDEDIASEHDADLSEPQRYEPDSSVPRAYPNQEEYNVRQSPVSHFHHDSNASSQHVSEAEDAGLDFVDINLGPSHNVSPYGAGAHFASRSAVEIRQDSISSGSVKAKELARMQDVLQRTSISSKDSSTSQRNDRTSNETYEIDDLQQEEVRTPKPSGITMTFANDEGEMDNIISPVIEKQSLSVEEENAEDVTKNDAPGAEEPASNVEESDKAEKEGGAREEIGTTAPEVTTALPTSPSLTDAADREPQGKRKDASKPSALEQHRSRTRMTNLPPKPKLEDTKHLHDFEAMMKLSRELELKKQEEEEDRKRKRDESLQERMKVWEKEILPSWTRARRENRLRKLWWKGVPPNLRGRIWALACGNSQMLPRNLFNKTSAEAREARTSGSFNKVDVAAIDADIEETLPSLRLFQKDGGALYDDLRDVLSAFTQVRADQQRTQAPAGPSKQQTPTTSSGDRDVDNEDEASAVYPIGVASLAAMLLINLSPSETLIALINLIAERPWLRALYSLSATHQARETKMIQRRASHAGNRAASMAAMTPLTTRSSVSSAAPRRPYADSSTALAGFERVFDTLLADQMPKVYANMQAHGVRPSAYVNDWIRTLFVPYLPFDAVARLWDCFLLEEKDALLFRTGIALVSLLSARLYVPDRDELVSILHGNNRAAIGVWTRVRTNGVESLSSPKLRDESTTEEEETSVGTVFAPHEAVPRDDVYGGQYGITERTIFDALEEQEAWWKDSVLERLLDREIVS